MNKFSVEFEFEQYTQRVNLDRRKVSANQWTETKRAFFGAFGQCLVLLRDDIGDLPEDAGVEVLQKMHDEVLRFWRNEAAAAAPKGSPVPICGYCYRSPHAAGCPYYN